MNIAKGGKETGTAKARRERRERREKRERDARERKRERATALKAHGLVRV